MTFTTLVVAACGSPVETAVRAELKDPESARFSDVRRCGKSEAYTGYVNAKNAYGGYAGKEAFFFAGGEAAVAGSLDSDRFARLADMCTNAMKAETARITANLEKAGVLPSAPPSQEGR